MLFSLPVIIKNAKARLKLDMGAKAIFAESTFGEMKKVPFGNSSGPVELGVWLIRCSHLSKSYDFKLVLSTSIFFISFPALLT